MGDRDTFTVRLDEEVDDYLDKKSDEWGVHRSDIINRAIKVYGAKVAKGEWKDPKFEDAIDEAIESL